MSEEPLRRRRALLAAGLMGAALPALALDPSKPIKIVVPYGPGGVADVMARITAAQMAQSLGQAVVVENRSGANANIGASFVAQSQPDGHTLLVSATYLNVNPLLEKALPWQPSALVPVARIALSPSVLVLSGKSPHSSLNDFLAEARKRPGMTFGDGGVGSSQTMAKQLLQHDAGVNFTSVLYKGGTSYLPDLLNGNLDMSILPLNLVLELVRSGQLKALAITSRMRSPLLPGVPTMEESGFPNASVESWVGFHAPAGTPEASIMRLSRAVGAATASEEVKSRFSSLGAVSSYLGTAEFEEFLKFDRTRAENYLRMMSAKS